jgi:hypothetical protein
LLARSPLEAVREILTRTLTAGFFVALQQPRATVGRLSRRLQRLQRRASPQRLPALAAARSTCCASGLR